MLALAQFWRAEIFRNTYGEYDQTAPVPVEAGATGVLEVPAGQYGVVVSLTGATGVLAVGLTGVLVVLMEEVL